MIRVGIVGYGNLGRGIELAIKSLPGFELICVFSRRDVNLFSLLDNNCKKDSIDNILNYKDKIDVMILCGGSKNDLPIQAPLIARHFNFVDSFDTHNKIPEYFQNLDVILKNNSKIGIISAGWDPGLFSLNRLLLESILPEGNNYTFWGEGVSQGHSDAIRRVNGVKYGIQYTVPKKEAIESVRKGEGENLSLRDKHKRVCYIVSENNKENERIEKEIKNMPDYFLEYDTEVYFLEESEFKEAHNKMPHGGFVIHNALLGENKEHKTLVEFSLKTESNPEFTASIVLAYARAVFKFAQKNDFGCKTVFDVPFAYLSAKSDEELRKALL